MKKQKIKKFFFLFTVLFVVLAQTTFAQYDREVRPNTSFDIDFALRTQGEYINAIEGDIRYDPKALTFLGMDDAQSTVPMWVEKFKDNGGVIHYSGIIPGGYKGEHVVMGVLRFMTKEVGITSLNIENTKIFRHDGDGTQAPLSSSSFIISVADSAPQEITEERSSDVFSPDQFSIQASRDQTVFGGKWFVVFLSHDKDSGIDHYEVAEKRSIFGRTFPIEALNWEKAESPYVLRDQSRSSYIYVKAVDRAGNVTISELSPSPINEIGKRYTVGMVIFFALVVLSTVIVWWEKKRRRDVVVMP